MENNYPIKYAAMPIIEQVGFTYGINELEREYDIVCYIVSKCHLISNLTKYKKDGSTILEHEVVFPYRLSDFSKWKRVFPEYNLYGQCTNSIKVDKMFDSYEDALKYVLDKNEKLCEKAYTYLPFSKDLVDEIKSKKNEFGIKLKEYKILEEQILLNTNDMKIGEIKKLNNVIKIENNHGKLLQSSIYEVLNLFKNEKFIVYSISDKQYNDLIKLIDNKKDNEVNYLKSQAQFLLINQTKDDLNIDENTLVFYTTETIEDLLNSYKEYPEIDLNEIKGPVLKKVKNN